MNIDIELGSEELWPVLWIGLPNNIGVDHEYKIPYEEFLTALMVQNLFCDRQLALEASAGLDMGQRFWITEGRP